VINNGSHGSIIFAALIGLLAMLGAPGRADAQVRGLYTPGVYSTNSGVQPEPGLTYSNLFLDYTFNELHGPDGERLQVLADIWQVKKAGVGFVIRLLSNDEAEV